MRVSELQTFLRNLGPAVAALTGAGSHEALSGAADALAPFASLSAGELADFLRRVEVDRQANGTPLAEPAGLSAVRGVAGRLNDAVRAYVADGDGTADKTSILQDHDSLRASLSELAGQFGLAVGGPNGADWLATARTTAAFREVAGRIADPSAYASPDVTTAIDRLGELGDDGLKAFAKTNGVSPGAKKGAELVKAILVKLTGVPLKATKASAPKAAKAPPPDLSGLIGELQEMAAKTEVDPYSVPSEDVEAIIARVQVLTPAGLRKDVATAVTGKPGKSADEAVLRIRVKLDGGRQLLDRQNV